MTKNVGGIDRVIRLVVALSVIGAGIYYQQWWGFIGIIPLATAMVGLCPAYLLFGFSSCKCNKK